MAAPLPGALHDRFRDPFHDQPTVADGLSVAAPAPVHAPTAAQAHAPTVVDLPLLVDPPLAAGPPSTVPRQGPTRAEVRRAAKRRRTTVPNPEHLKLARLVPRALVVAFLAGGTAAFVAHDKAVRLDVDGTPRTLHTFADDVTELLADEGVTVGTHDRVSPAPGTDLAHGDEVTVRYGRPLDLTLDGHHRRVWTTAGTVEEALRALGVRTEGAYLSVPRSAPVARTGLTLTVRTERTVTFMADGQERTLRTNAATVHEALAQAGITLEGLDTTSVAATSFPATGRRSPSCGSPTPTRCARRASRTPSSAARTPSCSRASNGWSGPGATACAGSRTPSGPSTAYGRSPAAPPRNWSTGRSAASCAPAPGSAPPRSPARTG